jgi:phage I-like protein
MTTVYAALSQPLGPAGFSEFRILPAGMFRSADGSGRPADVTGWLMNTRIAHGIIASLAARKDDVLIDYEHQSLQTAKNGGIAPAAGWFKRAEWREGDGLYAIDARWTDKAAAMISAKEYRFISPVFTFDKRNGEVQSLVSIGLVNQPALDGLTDLAAASACHTGDRDTDRAIEVFNRTFGMVGVFHPHTPPAEVARLRAEYGIDKESAACRAGKPAKPKASLAGVTAEDAAKLKHIFPGVFE